MAFDVWSTFRQMRPAADVRTRSFHARVKEYGCSNPRFKWYALYAWGLPGVILGVTLLMQYLPEELTKDQGFVVPGIGHKRCLLDEHEAMLFYFHVISAPVLAANVFLFALFVWNLCCGIWASSR